MTHGDILEPARFDGCPEPGNSVSGCFFFSEFPSVWFLGNCEQTPKGEVSFIFLNVLFFLMVNCMILFWKGWHLLDFAMVTPVWFFSDVLLQMWIFQYPSRSPRTDRRLFGGGQIKQNLAYLLMPSCEIGDAKNMPSWHAKNVLTCKYAPQSNRSSRLWWKWRGIGWLSVWPVMLLPKRFAARQDEKNHTWVFWSQLNGAPFFGRGQQIFLPKQWIFPLFSIGQGGIVALFRSNTPQKPCSNGTANPCDPQGACASGLAWWWCLQLMARASSLHVIIDGVGNNAAMKACGENSWWLSLSLLKTKEPDARATCAGISSMAGGAWEVSMEVMTQAASLLVESDVAIYNAALSALAGAEISTFQKHQVLDANLNFMQQKMCLTHISSTSYYGTICKNHPVSLQATIDGEKPWSSSTASVLLAYKRVLAA